MSQLPNYENSAAQVRSAITFGESQPEKPMLLPEPAPPGTDPTAAALAAFAGIAASAADAYGRTVKQKEEEREYAARLAASEERAEKRRKEAEARASQRKYEQQVTTSRAGEITTAVEAGLAANPEMTSAQLQDLVAKTASEVGDMPLPGSPAPIGSASIFSAVEVAALYAESKGAYYARELQTRVNEFVAEPNFAQDEFGNPLALVQSEEQRPVALMKMIEDLQIPEHLSNDHNFIIEFEKQVRDTIEPDFRETWDGIVDQQRQFALGAEIANTLDSILSEPTTAMRTDRLTDHLANEKLRSGLGNQQFNLTVAASLISKAADGDPKALELFLTARTPGGPLNAGQARLLYEKQRPSIDAEIERAKMQSKKNFFRGENERVGESVKQGIAQLARDNPAASPEQLAQNIEGLYQDSATGKFYRVQTNPSNGTTEKVPVDVEGIQQYQMETLVVEKAQAKVAENPKMALDEALAAVLNEDRSLPVPPRLKADLASAATLMKNYDGSPLSETDELRVRQSLQLVQSLTVNDDSLLPKFFSDPKDMALFQALDMFMVGTGYEAAVAALAESDPDSEYPAAPGKLYEALNALSQWDGSKVTVPNAQRATAQNQLRNYPYALQEQIRSTANLVVNMGLISPEKYEAFVKKNAAGRTIQSGTSVYLASEAATLSPVFENGKKAELFMRVVKQSVLSGTAKNPTIMAIREALIQRSGEEGIEDDVNKLRIVSTNGQLNGVEFMVGNTPIGVEFEEHRQGDIKTLNRLARYSFLSRKDATYSFGDAVKDSLGLVPGTSLMSGRGAFDSYKKIWDAMFSDEEEIAEKLTEDLLKAIEEDPEVVDTSNEDNEENFNNTLDNLGFNFDGYMNSVITEDELASAFAARDAGLLADLQQRGFKTSSGASEFPQGNSNMVQIAKELNGSDKSPEKYVRIRAEAYRILSDIGMDLFTDPTRPDVTT